MWACVSLCEWTIVCQCIWENAYECEHTYKQRHTQTYTVNFLVTEDCRCSSLTLKVAVDTKRHSVGVWWISVRPTWKAVQNTDRPRILMGGMCVSVCVRETLWEGEKGTLRVWLVVCVSLWQRTQESGARVCMSESFLYVCVSVCACRRNCLCICVFVYASAVVCICHCLLILCSLRANQRRTYQPCLLHINLVDVRATVWNPCQGITKHSTRNNRNTREKKCLLAPSLQLIVTSKTQNLRSISGELEALL